MKKSLTIVSLLAGAVGVYAQGTVQWQAYYPGKISIEVYGPQPTSPTIQTYGNSAYDIPAGGTTYDQSTYLGGAATGATSPSDYANGNLWSIQLYAGATSGLTASQLDPVAGATSTFATSAADAGEWNGGSTVAIPSSTGGSAGSATVQLYVWYNGGGTLTYAQALNAGDPVGVSQLLSIVGLGGGSPPATAPTIAGMTSFSLAVTPEPSTIALGVIGASAFLLRLRRK
jgi:hypothetical protein